MDLGVMLPTKADSWKVVVRAEELGYTHAWFYDTPLLNAELFAAMGAAAVKTSKIKLGSAVMIPSNRLAPVAASGLATLNALAPGRIIFGVSTGFTARRTMGLKPISFDRMCKYIEVVQGLLAGDIVDWDEEGERRKIRMIDPDRGLVNINDPIPLAISALGPKGRAAVAKYGAQLLGVSVDDVDAIGEMQTLWAQAGRDPKDLYMVSGGPGYVLEEGEDADSPKVRAQVGPGAAVLFHNAVEHEQFGSLWPGPFPFPDLLEQYRKIYQKYKPEDARYLSNHRGHSMYVRPDETHITGELIRTLGLVCSREQAIEKLRRTKEMGFSQVCFAALPGHESEVLERGPALMVQI